ncbi:MAG: c-type cytochrome biogenesis protein CcmI [Candidatus Dormibacteraceae bacterium]
MTPTLATLCLLLATPFVFWPLLRHWSAAPPGAAEIDSVSLRQAEMEEVEVDLESGRISPEEAARLRRELA